MYFKSINKLSYDVLSIGMSAMVLPFSVLADEKSVGAKISGINPDPTGGGYLVQLVAGLLIVLLCIVLLAWLAKRFNGFQSSSGGVLRVVDGMSMGARERVVLVQVGSTQLLLGVAPGRVTTLHVLEQPIEKMDEPSGQNFGRSFAEKLSFALMRGK